MTRRDPEPLHYALVAIAVGLLVGCAIIALGVWGSGRI